MGRAPESVSLPVKLRIDNAPKQLAALSRRGEPLTAISSAKISLKNACISRPRLLAAVGIVGERQFELLPEFVGALLVKACLAPG